MFQYIDVWKLIKGFATLMGEVIILNKYTGSRLALDTVDAFLGCSQNGRHTQVSIIITQTELYPLMPHLPHILCKSMSRMPMI